MRHQMSFSKICGRSVFLRRSLCSCGRPLKNRLPSKENLKKSNIIVRDEDMLCPCLQKSETIPLFFYCELASKVWNECYSWIAPDFATTSPGDMEAHYWYIKWLGRSKLEREIWQYI